MWIGVQPRDRIDPLHDKVDRVLAQVGVAADARTFLPHITLARFARSATAGAEVARRIAIPPLPGFAITRFALYESFLGAGGASYQAIKHYPLRD